VAQGPIAHSQPVLMQLFHQSCDDAGSGEDDFGAKSSSESADTLMSRCGRWAVQNQVVNELEDSSAPKRSRS
jgi:hypothetical protein